MALAQVMIEKLEQHWDDAFAMCSTSDGKKISKNERATMNISKGRLAADLPLVAADPCVRSVRQRLWCTAR